MCAIGARRAYLGVKGGVSVGRGGHAWQEVGCESSRSFGGIHHQIPCTQFVCWMRGSQDCVDRYYEFFSCRSAPLVSFCT